MPVPHYHASCQFLLLPHWVLPKRDIPPTPQFQKVNWYLFPPTLLQWLNAQTTPGLMSLKHNSYMKGYRWSAYRCIQSTSIPVTMSTCPIGCSIRTPELSTRVSGTTHKWVRAYGKCIKMQQRAHWNANREENITWWFTPYFFLLKKTPRPKQCVKTQYFSPLKMAHIKIFPRRSYRNERQNTVTSRHALWHSLVPVQI